MILLSDLHESDLHRLAPAEYFRPVPFGLAKQGVLWTRGKLRRKTYCCSILVITWVGCHSRYAPTSTRANVTTASWATTARRLRRPHLRRRCIRGRLIRERRGNRRRRSQTQMTSSQTSTYVSFSLALNSSRVLIGKKRKPVGSRQSTTSLMLEVG